MLTRPLPMNNLVLISLLLVLSQVLAISAENDITNIGAILNIDSSIGQEEKVSMEIAFETFSSAYSSKHKLVLHVRNSGGHPLKASAAAEELIKDKQVQAIIGMDTWNEALLVTEVANRARIPILSFSAPSVIPPFTSKRWPFLVRMASNDAIQVKCVASIVRSFAWRKVIAIYEDDSYNNDMGILSLLSDSLGAVGTEIEHALAFPPFSTISDPMFFIEEALETVMFNNKSRVFIILRSSLELATHVFAQAQHLGMMGKDSVWITTDSVTSILHDVNSSVISSMQGLIGIKPHFSDTTPSFLSFSTKFSKKMRSMGTEEKISKPGIHALRAHDAVSTVALALEKTTNRSPTNSSRIFLQNLLSINFNGLSGKIQFENAGLSPTAYEIVNWVGKSYKVLNVWSPENGFDAPGNKKSRVHGGTLNVVYWPGGVQRAPLGWAMPSEAQPLIIGIPAKMSFEKFVDVKEGEEPTGFCIDVFKNAVKLLSYPLPHEFKSMTGTYNHLVDHVYSKDIGAAVGDITILANRSNYVEFTQPYTESGLTMIVPVKWQRKGWLFAEPFSGTLWLVVGIVFVYTVLVVWFLEREKKDPKSDGSKEKQQDKQQDKRQDKQQDKQLSTAAWFIFSTLFFTQGEKINRNFTRVVVVVWLFVVLVITSNYTASLTSILTVRRLERTVETDIETLRKSNDNVGCDGTSFIRIFLENVLNFHSDNIINIRSEYDYPEAFKTGRIKAAFLEIPNAKVFLARYCKDYQVAGKTYRFGGLGFVFPKGSPLARDFSKAFLQLSEDGTLNKLEKYWFQKSPECYNLEGVTDHKNLSLSNFWTLLLITLLTSTIMLILQLYVVWKKGREEVLRALNLLEKEEAKISRLEK